MYIKSNTNKRTINIAIYVKKPYLNPTALYNTLSDIMPIIANIKNKYLHAIRFELVATKKLIVLFPKVEYENL